MKHIHTFESFINEGTDYAVMLIGGSIGDKPRPRDAKGYAGMDIDKEQELTNLNDAKAKAKRMNANLSPGEKSHYGLKYVVVPAKDGKFIKESVNETIDTKYWAGYNKDTSGQGNKDFEEKSKDFDDTFSLAVSDWNTEADGAENRIKGAQIDKVKKIAQEFFKKEGYISVNIAQAMIAQES